MAEELLTIKDVQHVTQLSRTKVYELIRDGELPVVRIGRSVRVRQVALDRWLVSHEDSTDGPTPPPPPRRCPTCGGQLSGTPGTHVVSLQEAALRRSARDS